MEHNFYRKPLFTIKAFPKDVYAAVGEIIKESQEWEKDYKELAKRLNVPIKNVDNSSLNKLNEALKKNNVITKEQFEILKKVIDNRNSINHYFFINDFHKDYAEVETILNDAYFWIHEATDFTNNLIDKQKGSNIMRPLAFDI